VSVPNAFAAPDPEAGPADLRLAPAAAGAWAAAFVAPLVPTGARWWLAGGLAAFGAVGLAASRNRSSRRGAVVSAGAVALLVTAAVGAVASIGLLSAQRGPVPALAAERAVGVVELTVTGDPQAVRSAVGLIGAEPVMVVPALIETIQARGERWTTSTPVIVLASGRSWADVLPSTRLEVTGRLGPTTRIAREVALLRVSQPATIIRGPDLAQRVAGSVRAGLRRAVDDLGPDPRGLVPAVVDGDERLMPPDLVTDAQISGLTHLTAVSGANVSIVLAVVLSLARWVGARAYAIPAIGLIAIVAFVVLARPQPSVLRAAVMGAAVVIGLGVGAQRRRLAPLLVATVVLLLLDPWLARSYGFALSVIASGAIVILVPGWTARWSRLRWMPEPVAAAIAVPLAAALACAPVVVLLSGQVSLVAVLANVLAAPAVAPATVLGVVVAASAVVAPGPTHLVAQLAGLPASWIAKVARWCADLPYAAVPWPGNARGALTLALVLLVGALLARRLIASPPLAALVLVPLLAVAATQVVAPGWPTPGWRFVACNVGQGDGLVLATGGASAVVVDTGPDPAAMDDCLDDLGIEQVPLVVITHGHADHVGGLAGVALGRAVGAVVTGAMTLAAIPADVTSVAPTAVATGDVLRVGPLTLSVLWPPPGPTLPGLDPDESYENDASVVLMVEDAAGLRLLLAGDLEPSAQRALEASGVDLRADVLKVAHHGSAYQDPGFLQASGASLAVVSVGADNDYGHPAASTLAALRSTGAEIRRTDQVGDIAIGGRAGQVWAASWSH
jgi:competence protein ComEC